jgi:hypothetical protein
VRVVLTKPPGLDLDEGGVLNKPVIAVRIEPSRQRVFVTASGDVSARDVVGALELMYRDPRFRSSMTKLWDLQRAHLTISSRGIHDIVSFLSERPELEGAGRTAVVTGRDADYGMVRVAEVHVEQLLGTELMVFRAADEAESWLGGENGYDAPPPTLGAWN